MDGEQKPKVRTCPVCEESVLADAKICPSCSTDLSLFPVDDAAAQDASVDHDSYVADILKQAEAAPVTQAAAQMDQAECPACNKLIPADAAKCPFCGAEFEVEEVFECPLCKTLLDVSVTKCPSCGAVFEEEPAPPAAEPEEPPAAQPQAEAPPPEQPSQPASFAERLKQIKDEPASDTPAEAAPKREMTFAERMKAMKDGTLQEGEPAPKPAPPKSEPVHVQPAQQQAQTPAQPAPQPANPQEAAPAPTKGPPSIADRVQSLKQSTQQTQPEPAPVQPAHQPQPQPQPRPQPAPQQPSPEPAKEGYKELPHHIADVKKLLLLANELKLDVSTSKALINKAVTAGKNRDLENAIKLVKEGKAGLERDIRSNMTAKLRTLETAIGLEKKAGKNVSGMETMAADIRKTMDVGDHQQAWEGIRALEDTIMKSASGKLSEVEVETISHAIANAEMLRLNVSDAKMLLEDAKAAIAANDAARASQDLKQAMESLNRVLPAFIAGEMRKAKVTLREVKMMNVDITGPVAILKEANDHVARGDYCAALAEVRKFREFIDKAMPA